MKIDGAYKQVDEGVVTYDGLTQGLTALGGAALLPKLGPQPIQGNFRAGDLGELAFIAQRPLPEVIQIRFLRRGSQGSQPPKAPTSRPPGAPSRPAVQPVSEPEPPPVAAEPPPPPPPPKLAELLFDANDLEGMVDETLRLRASDLHVVADRPALFRVAGELQPRGKPLSAELVEKILIEKVPERLKPALEKDGSVDFALELDGGPRLRANVSRQRTGYKGCFRVIPEETPTLASLGLPEDIAKATHHHQGLIVVTGPSGHGKTTTLAALVDIINRETTHHVITVEDPIEFIHSRKKAMMSQREVGTHTKSFAAALKGSLREDPDVIVVGELRDLETVRMALSAAETGHLVISTMNTPSAAKTIDRLIDLFPPGDQAQVRMSLSTGLRLIVSQRLVPNTGRTGVVAAAELLPGSIALGNLIRDNKTFQIPSLQQRGKSIGIVRLDDSLVDLVKSGLTTLEAAKEYAESPEELEATITGKRLPVAPPGAPGAGGPGLLSKVGSLVGKKGA